MYWDNLYPSKDIAQAMAKGGTWAAEVPAGPDAGTTHEITIPPTLTCGTARTNCGVPAACKQPNPKTDKLSQKQIDALKGKPLA